MAAMMDAGDRQLLARWSNGNKHCESVIGDAANRECRKSVMTKAGRGRPEGKRPRGQCCRLLCQAAEKSRCRQLTYGHRLWYNRQQEKRSLEHSRELIAEKQFIGNEDNKQVGKCV